MNELDNKIREALRKEDAELFEEFCSEPSMYEMIMETFRGKYRWMAFVAVFWTLVFIVLFILAGIRFFNAETTKDMLMWAAGCVVCWSAVFMMKVWYWMELNKNSLTREIKRLELQIARLAGRLNG
jgi:uncharacterized membrane protein YciS (DUF1049 family)